MKIKQILNILFLACSTIVSAQNTKDKVPEKAVIYSTILPGAGQIYTKNYWKVPIIYAGLITSAYYIQENNESYQLYKNIYLNRLAGINSDVFQEEYSQADLKILTDHYRRNREISILCFIGTYILNIIDASVSAHLFNYDVSDDLSIHIQPIYLSSVQYPAIALSFNL